MELDKYFWSKEALKDGSAIGAINPINVVQTYESQSLAQTDRDSWNNKVDRPIISAGKPNSLTPGQIYYNPATDEMQIYLNGKFRDAGSNRECHGSAKFSGQNKETVIPHNIVNNSGTRVVPKFVGITCCGNPQGRLGEYWVRKDDVNIYVGNTGSYTGYFDYMAYY